MNPPEILRTRAKADTKRIKMETRAKKKEVRQRKKMSKHPKIDEEYEVRSCYITIINKRSIEPGPCFLQSIQLPAIGHFLNRTKI